MCFVITLDDQDIVAVKAGEINASCRSVHTRSTLSTRCRGRQSFLHREVGSPLAVLLLRRLLATVAVPARGRGCSIRVPASDLVAGCLARKGLYLEVISHDVQPCEQMSRTETKCELSLQN